MLASSQDVSPGFRGCFKSLIYYTQDKIPETPMNRSRRQQELMVS